MDTVDLWPLADPSCSEVLFFLTMQNDLDASVIVEGIYSNVPEFTYHACEHSFLMRNHLTLFVSSAKSYLLPLSDEGVSDADGELDDGVKPQPSGLGHLLCHLKAGNWLASSYLLL